MCVMQTGVLFLSLSGSGRGNFSIYIKGLPAVLEGMGRLVCSTGCTKQCHICPKLAHFWYIFGLVWHTIGIYCSAISTFLEPLDVHKASSYPVISKLKHHFYLQCPPSHKHCDPWDVECLLSLLERWALASSLTTFKLDWKTATLLALVTVNCCSDLTLLCMDNQHLFLQHHAAIFNLMSDGKTDHWCHLPPQIVLSLTQMLIFALFFIWRLIWDVLNHLGWYQMDHMWLLFFGYQ